MVNSYSSDNETDERLVYGKDVDPKEYKDLAIKILGVMKEKLEGKTIFYPFLLRYVNLAIMTAISTVENQDIDKSRHMSPIQAAELAEEFTDYAIKVLVKKGIIIVRKNTEDLK